MMAFERLEPWGTLHAEYLAGTVCATTANIHLPRDAQAMTADDFMPALHSARIQYADRLPAPQLTDEERSALIDRALFGARLH